MFDKNYDGLVPDSAHWDKGTAETRGKSIYIWKAYLEQQKIDSIYETNLRNKEWTYKTTKVPYDSIKVSNEGNVWTLEGITTDGGISSETVYFDADSIATTSNDEERLIWWVASQNREGFFLQCFTWNAIEVRKRKYTCVFSFASRIKKITGSFP